MEKTLDVPIFRVSRLITTDKFDKLYAEVKGQGVSVSALLAKAVAMTLERYPILNAAYDPSGAIKYNPGSSLPTHPPTHPPTHLPTQTHRHGYRL